VHIFTCDRCEQVVFFHNTRCLRCEADLAFDPLVLDIVVDDGTRRCANRQLAACSWLADGPGERCRSCQLTRTRPADDDAEGLARFAVAEGAKRRLIHNLLTFGLPIEPYDEARGTGVAFDLLASTDAPVTTGHAGGVITLDLAESDDVHREQVRSDMEEPYRTVLGHFRHEIGHYYFPVLVGDADRAEARSLFGDESQDYQAAIDRHYDRGAPADWADAHVSTYATMHPAEDWAETFAHYLHIRATLQTAGAYGLRVDTAAATRPVGAPLVADPAALDPSDVGAVDIEAIIATWLPLSYALNAVSRSIGDADLYPFVLPPPVIDKLGFVHRVVRAASA
jgi:hypothetical protein